MDERMPLDAVVFDAGGTLVRLNFEWIAGMLGTLGVSTTADALRRAEVAGRRALDRAAGIDGTHDAAAGTTGFDWRGPTRAYFTVMLTTVGCPNAQLPEALQQLDQRQQSEHFLWGCPVDGAREVLDALPALGLRAACVSNSDGRAEAHLERFGLRDGLEFVVDSTLVGIEKPDPRIFDIALDRLGVQPIRALYVGDIRAGDEVGSRSAGMHFVLIDPYGDYAPRDVASISTLAELPEFLAARFLTPSAPERRGGAHTT